MAGNWTIEEKKQIVEAFTVLATIQRSYGREVEIKPTLQAWEYVLSDFSALQVCAAMRIWMKKENQMPTPADLIKIIQPEPAKVSHAEFIHAKEQWKLEGYTAHSYYAAIVKDYEREQLDSRNPEPKSEIPLGQLVDDVKKQIEPPAQSQPEKIEYWNDLSPARQDEILHIAKLLTVGKSKTSVKSYLDSYRVPDEVREGV